MRDYHFAAATVFATLAIILIPAMPFAQARTADTTQKAVSAANSFLAMLNDVQRAKVNLPLNKTTRSNWSNLPTGARFQSGATERNGLKFGVLTAAEQEAAAFDSAYRDPAVPNSIS